MNKRTTNHFRQQLLRYVRCYLSQMNGNEKIGHRTDAQVDQLISTTNVITVLSRRRWYYKGSGHNSSAVLSSFLFLSLAARSSTMISQRQWVVIIRQLCCSSSSLLQFVRPRWYHKGSGHISSAVLYSSSASQIFRLVLAPGENDIWRSPTKLRFRWVICLV